MKSPAPVGVPIGNPEEFLAHFAAGFVIKEFRERFVHEALKKPQRLATRLCHDIEEVFAPVYRGASCPFADDDVCVGISGTGQNLRECRWKDLALYVGGGGGALIAARDGLRFYAETETEYGSPYKVYAGSRKSG